MANYFSKIFLSLTILFSVIYTLEASAARNEAYGCDMGFGEEAESTVRKEPKAYCQRALFFIERSQLESAIESLSEAVELDPNYAESYLMRGILYFKQQDRELAVADFRKVREIDPGNIYSYLLEAMYHMSQLQWQSALSDVNRSLAIEPPLADSFITRGNIYMLQKQWDKALSDFNRAVEIDPDAADTYRSRAIYYMVRDRFSLALADYERAIELNPASLLIYLNRSLLYAETQQWNKLLEDAQKSTQLSPESVKAHILLGYAYHKKQEYNLAVDNYQKAIFLHDNSQKDTTEQFNITQNYDPQDYEKFQSDIELDDMATIRYYIGIAQYEKNFARGAIESFKVALERNEELSQSKLALATVLYSQGKTDRALKLARSALISNQKLSNPQYLQEKQLWGEKMLEDGKELLSTLVSLDNTIKQI